MTREKLSDSSVRIAELVLQLRNVMWCIDLSLCIDAVSFAAGGPKH
jgi:hypothetical protein